MVNTWRMDPKAYEELGRFKKDARLETDSMYAFIVKGLFKSFSRDSDLSISCNFWAT